VSRLLQPLRGFSHRQSVERLELLGFIPDEAAVRRNFYLPQRADLDVLAGAGDLIKTCTAIIAELSFPGSNEEAPLAADVISGIERVGFKCTDVCNLRRARLVRVESARPKHTNAASRYHANGVDACVVEACVSRVVNSFCKVPDAFELFVGGRLVHAAQPVRTCKHAGYMPGRRNAAHVADNARGVVHHHPWVIERAVAGGKRAAIRQHVVLLNAGCIEQGNAVPPLRAAGENAELRIPNDV
jgi:hypothetical protein